jgi:hypothetical protein
MVGGMGLTNHRERMMNDRRIKKIVHFSGRKEIFKNVSIAGGVNYFLWQKKYNGECEFINDGDSIKRNLNDYDIILQDNKAISILQKIQTNCSKFISQRTISTKPFGLPTNYSGWANSGTKCISKERKVRFVVSDFTDKHGVLNKWKVCTNQSTVEGASFTGKERSYFSRNGIFIIEPGTICTETYIVINCFNTKTEAENFVAYMKTKFFRYMLGLRVVTQHINKEKFAWVPDLEDYSRSWTDEELYHKFELTNDETKHIESKIKPIVKCISQGKKEHFINQSDFTDKHGVLNKWKVCTSKARNMTKDHSGAIPIFTNFFIIEPGTICTQTYIVVNCFNTKTEAENFVSYMKTKFFRFMLGLRTITQDINKEKFAWVPDLEDYSKPWTDEELYRKFGLDEDEIRYIESKIKPIV